MIQQILMFDPICWFGIRIPKQVTRNHGYYWNYDIEKYVYIYIYIHTSFTHLEGPFKKIHGDPSHMLHTLFLIFLQINRQSASYGGFLK